MEASITTETNTITTPPTKPDHETPKTTNVGKITIPTRIGKNTLSHSSSTGSSPDSPLVVDPFKIDDDDDDKSVSSTDSSPSRKRDRSKKCSTIEAPCNQEMERPAYRIPSSVFARNESKAEMDWSVASNESLFSIHEENANGHPFWRSGELSDGQASTSTTGHMFSYSAQQPRCAEVIKSRELGLLAVATMKEVIMESETNQIDFEIPLAMASQCSRGSSTSTKSFAFSSKIVEGSKKDGLSRTHSSVRSIPEEQAQCQPQTQVTAKSKSKSEAEAEAKTQPATKNRDQKTDQAPMASTAVHRRKWFPNFFSCCSL